MKLFFKVNRESEVPLKGQDKVGHYPNIIWMYEGKDFMLCRRTEL